MLTADEDFEGYVIDATLGRGGYATVYRAHRAGDPDHPVALKILDEDQRHEDQTARLRREFEFAHEIHHPHVITVYEHGPGWLTMELIDGGTSSALPGVTEKLTVLAQVADALDHIHHQGIVHCDVKPSNILATKDFSRAVLTDFGVAYTVAETVDWRYAQLEASLHYTAPELLHGRPPSALTDQYALAVTAVELLLGAPPFTAENPMELVDAHLNQPVPDYSDKIDWVPRIFDSVLGRALAKIPESRYDTCAELIAQLTHALD
ncbi:serine/threonine protein kinase [Mycolicibacterium agri]|uniref:non-specific serine/threonine protein kinase n=1 Tax=Mycolicibacterium agri TaxID=36811 RepID=A0A2A7N259_MYCAG|nr:serine/threonine-protein kinase [Mycolicibacterium agri]PEG37611.1 serine/threonine protein kinase [Mycolicibacterium agri]GFG55608.1 protein kinase [Mycolicibacterium agri]